MGAGRAGRRKAQRLAAAGADVHLVDSFDPVAPTDLDGAWLVVTATGDVATNAAIESAAEARGIWVNRADRPDGGPIAFAAGLDRGPVHVGITTGGASPALAAWLRDRIAAALPPEVADLAGLVASRSRDAAESRDHVDLPFDEALAALQAGDRAGAAALVR